MTTLTLGSICLLAGFMLGVVASKKAQKKRLMHFAKTITEGYFQNTLLSGLAKILFYEHANDVFEISVHGVIYKVFQRDKDIFYEKKV
jgi:hypothetical protein